ncbi:MAG: hypothetical protein Q8O76_01855 [Chloroflexota bacterium]|nr:hypothetical protein [Chloroflexota bacterium]
MPLRPIVSLLLAGLLASSALLAPVPRLLDSRLSVRPGCPWDVGAWYDGAVRFL